MDKLLQDMTREELTMTLTRLAREAVENSQKFDLVVSELVYRREHAEAEQDSTHESKS